MVPIILVSFREFLELFLLIGVFLNISRQLSLDKEKTILFTGLFGITISLLISIISFFLGEKTELLLSGKGANTLEGYLFILSGIFISFVVVSLYNFLGNAKQAALKKAYDRFCYFEFDLLLFFTIVFFILREEFEIATFTITTSLFSFFITKIIGLFLGLVLTSPIGILVFLDYENLNIKRLFYITESLLVFLGAIITMEGISILIKVYFRIYLDKILSLQLHFLGTLSGFQKDISFMQLGIVALYVFIFVLLLKRSKQI